MSFNNGLSFVLNYSDKLIIPELDISECDINSFTYNTLNEWKIFCNSLNDSFDKVVQKIKKLKYKTTINNNLFIKIPYNFTGCIWENYPNLYNCNGEQVLLFLEKTKTKLSDVYIKTNPFQSIVNSNITPETFINLSINDYLKLTKILIENGETNPTIWCAVACWWNYLTEITNDAYLEQTYSGGFGKWFEKNINQKHESASDSSFDNDDEWIIILNEFCCPKLYTRCNWFLILQSRVISSNSTKLLDWIDKNKQFVVWDEDLLSDTPSHAFNACYQYYNDNECIENELKKRFI